MNPQSNTYSFWPAKYSYYGIGAALVTFLVIQVYFGTSAISPIWLLINLLAICAYFIAINIVSSRSVHSSDRKFVVNLFWMALIARLLFMLTIVILAELTWDRPFYVGAVDAVRYHRVATEVAELLISGSFLDILPHLLWEYGAFDDIGVPLVLGPVYVILGSSPIVGKLFFTLIGTGTVLLSYKTAKLIWNESVARLAGIMLAFFPLALFYSSVILKEEFVVFLSLLAIYIATKVVKNNKMSLRDLFLLLFAMVFIFFFRTAAGALLVTVVIGTFFLNRFGGNMLYTVVISGAVFFSFTLFMNLFTEIDFYLERIVEFDDFADARVQSVARGNILATIVGTPVYVLIAFIAPFPAMIFTPNRFGLSHDATFYWISGLVIWNFIIYFGLAGLWRSLRTNIRESFPVWAFAAGYSIILGLTAMFTSVRFGYNAMPAFFILIAVGVHHRQKFPYWQLYLVGAVFVIFAWNYFRLAGRGML